MLLLLSLLCVFVPGGVCDDLCYALVIVLWWSLWCFQTLAEIHLLFVSASSVVLSSSLLSALDPNIDLAPSLVPLEVFLSVFGWLSAFSGVLHSVCTSLWQNFLAINYPIRLLPDFFVAASIHLLHPPVFSLDLLVFDKYDPNSLSVVCTCCVVSSKLYVGV